MLRLAQTRDQSRGDHYVARSGCYFQCDLSHADPDSCHLGGEVRVGRRPSQWFSCAWEASSDRYVRVVWHEGSRTVARTGIEVIKLMSSAWVRVSGSSRMVRPVLLSVGPRVKTYKRTARLVGRRSSVVCRRSVVDAT